MLNYKISQKSKRYSILLFISILVLMTSGCIILDLLSDIASVPRIRGLTDTSEGDSLEIGSQQGYAGDEATSPGQIGQTTSSGGGDLKPVGFVNYGEFDAVVRAETFIPLGEMSPKTPSNASTVSSANTGSGEWPNTSRFLSLPMGAYSWCIDWEEGDLDDDGQVDYFHYYEDGPTILDENDSDDLNFAEEVAISAPPAAAQIFAGKCQEEPVKNACTEFNSEVNVYTYLAYESDNPPQIKAFTNLAEAPSQEGIQVSVGGSGTPWGLGMILWSQGDYVEATTSNSYTAFGGQIFGDHTIGWGRVLFDGVEIWRGDASSYTIMEGAQYGVYVEVRCFPPGTHTMRIECLGLEGSGGGSSLPAGFFGFRE